jgi:hypothetical protein
MSNREDWIVILFGPAQIVESAHPDKPGLTFDQAEAILAAYIVTVQMRMREKMGLQS